MLFHTWTFLAFFIVFYLVYIGVLRFKTSLWTSWVLIASYVFYGWWNPWFCFLMLYSTALDYAVVLRMEKSEKKKFWLWVSLVNNLGILCLFKYSDFLIENVNNLLALGTTYELPGMPNWWVLPVGISFFTFQSMSYTIDYYRGHIKAEKNFIRFAAFVSLFPQLVAGPIERASNLLPQMSQKPKINPHDISDGLSLFVVGLFKKVALANYLSRYVDQVYTMPGNYSSMELTLATFAFAWQIFFDFSGYTDMARGIARCMGFKLMLNFNNPYQAISLKDFWSRWHISLSTWFKDYVYIPLGGSRSGKWRTYRNLLITFVISGIWHGAGWNFLIWGILHGLGNLLNIELDKKSWWQKIPDYGKKLSIFIFVCFAWIFFRAETFADAQAVISGIFSFNGCNFDFPILALLLVTFVWFYQAFYNSHHFDFLEKKPIKISLTAAMIIYIMLAPGSGEQAFIYFQF